MFGCDFCGKGLTEWDYMTECGHLICGHGCYNENEQVCPICKKRTKFACIGEKVKDVYNSLCMCVCVWFAHAKSRHREMVRGFWHRRGVCSTMLRRLLRYTALFTFPLIDVLMSVVPLQCYGELDRVSKIENWEARQGYWSSQTRIEATEILQSVCIEMYLCQALSNGVRFREIYELEQENAYLRNKVHQMKQLNQEYYHDFVWFVCACHSSSNE